MVVQFYAVDAPRQPKLHGSTLQSVRGHKTGTFEPLRFTLGIARTCGLVSR